MSLLPYKNDDEFEPIKLPIELLRKFDPELITIPQQPPPNVSKVEECYGKWIEAITWLEAAMIAKKQGQDQLANIFHRAGELCHKELRDGK
jgi:hypothetical protein